MRSTINTLKSACSSSVVMKISQPTAFLLLVQLLSAVAWTPHTPQQFLNFEELCMDVLDVPERHKALFRDHIYPDDHVTQCYHRCLGIASGIYTDRDGVDLGRVYTQFGAGRNETQFRQGAEQCFAWLLMDLEQGEGIRSEKCEKPFLMYKCFAKFYLEQFKRN